MHLLSLKQDQLFAHVSQFETEEHIFFMEI